MSRHSPKPGRRITSARLALEFALYAALISIADWLLSGGPAHG